MPPPPSSVYTHSNAVQLIYSYFFPPVDKCDVIVRFVNSRLLFRYATGIETCFSNFIQGVMGWKLYFCNVQWAKGGIPFVDKV